MLDAYFSKILSQNQTQNQNQDQSQPVNRVTIPTSNTAPVSSFTGGTNLFWKPAEEEEEKQENKNSNLGIIGRSVSLLPQSIAKGTTSELNRMADFSANMGDVYAQSRATNIGDFASRDAAVTAAQNREKAQMTHALGAKVSNWERDVDTKQEAILNDNPNSKLAKAGYYLNELGGEGVGRMAPSIAAAAITGGVLGAASGGTAGLTARAALGQASAKSALKSIGSISSKAGLGAMFAGVYSNSYEEAIKQGADYASAGKKAMADGLLEIGTEMMFGGIAGLGQGYISKAAKSVAASNATEALAKVTGMKRAGLLAASTIAKVSDMAERSSGLRGMLFDALGEGAEEMIAEFVGPFIEKATTNPYANNATIAEILQAGLGGALLAFAMKPVGAVRDRIMTGGSSRIEQERIKFRTSDFNQVSQELYNYALNGITDEESRTVAGKILGKELTPTEVKGSDGAWIVKPFDTNRGGAARVRELGLAIKEARENGAERGNRQAFDTFLEKASNIFQAESEAQMELAAASSYKQWAVGEYLNNNAEYKSAIQQLDDAEGKYNAARLKVEEAVESGQSEEEVSKLRSELDSLEQKRQQQAQVVTALQNKASSEENLRMTEERVRKFGGEERVQEWRAYQRVLQWRNGSALLAGPDGNLGIYNRYTLAEALGGTYYTPQEIEYFQNHPEAIAEQEERATAIDAVASGESSSMTEEEILQAQAQQAAEAFESEAENGVTSLSEEDAALMQEMREAAGEPEPMTAEDAEQAAPNFEEETEAAAASPSEEYEPNRPLRISENDIEISRKVDQQFEEYNNERIRELNEFKDEANKALEEQGYKDKLHIEVDVYDTSDIGSYDPATGVIQISPSRVHDAEGAKFVLAHEMLHAISNRAMSREQFDAFGETIEQAMEAMGFDLANTYNAVKPRYGARYYDSFAQEADAKKLTGDAKEKYIIEEIDRACKEEVYARFMSVAFGSDGILQAMAKLNPQLLSQMRSEVERSSIAKLPQTMWDFTRLQILDRIDKAIASPADPEEVREELEVERQMFMASLSDEYEPDPIDRMYSTMERAVKGMSLQSFRSAMQNDNEFKKYLRKLGVGQEEWDYSLAPYRLKYLRWAVKQGLMSAQDAQIDFANWVSKASPKMHMQLVTKDDSNWYPMPGLVYNKGKGASTYREFLFTMPGNAYEHWLHWQDTAGVDPEGVIGHIRSDVQTARDDSKVFFLEELQSDAHSDAQEKKQRSSDERDKWLGYKSEADPSISASLRDARNALSEAIKERDAAEKDFKTRLAEELRKPQFADLFRVSKSRYVYRSEDGYTSLIDGSKLSEQEYELLPEAIPLTAENVFDYNYNGGEGVVLYNGEYLDSKLPALWSHVGRVYTDKYDSALKEIKYLNEDIDAAEAELGRYVDNAPYAKDRMARYLLQRSIQIGAEEGLRYVAWPTSKMQTDRYNYFYNAFERQGKSVSSEGYHNLYDTYLIKEGKKLAESLGGRFTYIEIPRDRTIERLSPQVTSIYAEPFRAAGWSNNHAELLGERVYAEDYSKVANAAGYPSRLTADEREFLADIDKAMLDAAPGLVRYNQDQKLNVLSPRALYNAFPEKYQEYKSGASMDENGEQIVLSKESRDSDFIRVPAIEITPKLKDNIKKGQSRYMADLSDDYEISPVDKMYSNVERAINGMTEQNLRSALGNPKTSLRAYFRKLGITDDEIHFSGVIEAAQDIWQGYKSGGFADFEEAKDELIAAVRYAANLEERVLSYNGSRDDYPDFAKYRTNTELLLQALERHGYAKLGNHTDVIHPITGELLLDEYDIFNDYFGGRNYQEFLYTDPTGKYDFGGTHFSEDWRPDDPIRGLIGHARTTDRTTADGKSVFYIDEIQSDLHSKGAKTGYKGTKKAEDFDAKHQDLRRREEQLRKDLDSARARIIEDIKSRLYKDDFEFLNSAVQNYFGGLGYDDSWNQVLETKAAFPIRFNEFVNDLSITKELAEKTFDGIPTKLWDSYTNLVSAAHKLRNEIWEMDASLSNGHPAIAPFSKDRAQSYILRRLLRHAVEGGYDYIALTTPELQAELLAYEHLEVPDASKLKTKDYEQEYGKHLKGLLEKYAQEWGTELVEVELPLFGIQKKSDSKTAETYYDIRKTTKVPALPITQKMIDTIQSKGLPRFGFQDISDEDFISPVDRMYSKSAKALAELNEQSLRSAFGRGSETYMRKYLKKKGISDDEMKWSGILTKIKTTRDRYHSQEITLDQARKELLDYAKAAGTLMETKLTGNSTKYDEYQLPYPAENYAEYLYSVPDSEFLPVKHHYPAGTLGFVRANTRYTIDGDEVFYVEEGQSDWHNQGRNNGYFETEEELAANKEAVDKKVAAAKEKRDAAAKEYLTKRRELISKAQTRIARDPYKYYILNRLVEKGDLAGFFAENRYEDSVKEVDEVLKDMIGSYVETLYDKNGDSISKYGNYKLSDYTDSVGFFSDQDLSDIVDAYFAYQDANEAFNELNRQPPYGAPAAPYSQDSAETYMLLRSLMHAVENGADYFAWSTADIQAKRWSESYRKGMELEYDKRMVNFMNTFAAQFNSKVENLELQAGAKEKSSVLKTPSLMDMLPGLMAQSKESKLSSNPSAPSDKYANENGNYTVHGVRITNEMRSALEQSGVPRWAFDDLGDDFGFDDARLSEYQALMAKYGGYENGTPKQISQHVGVSQTVDKILGNQALTTSQLKSSLLNSVLEGQQGLTHVIMSDDNAKAKAVNRIRTHKTLGEAYTDATNALQAQKAPNTYDIAFAEQVIIDMADRIRNIEAGKDIRENESKDTTELFNQMQHLIGDLCAAGTRAGQNLQAFRLLKKLTPTGRLYYIQAQLDQLVSELYDRKGYSRVGGFRYLRDAKGNVVRDSNGQPVQLKIRDDLVKKMEACKSKQEMDLVEEEILDDIASKVPPTMTDRIVAWRYLAMLGNPRTHIRNMVSNFAMGVAVRAKDRVGGTLEDIFLKDRGNTGRTKTNQRIDPALKKALQEFAIADWDTENVSDYALSGGKVAFQSKINERRNKLGFGKFNLLDKFDKWNSAKLEKEDYGAAKRAYRNAFVSYCAANNLTPQYLLSGTTASNTRLAQARSYAVNEAAKATYHDANALATHLNQIEKMNSASKIIVGGLVPFKKTPANILKRGLEYSPISVVTGIKDFMNAKNLNLQDFIDERMGEYNAAPITKKIDGKWQQVSGAQDALDISRNPQTGMTKADLRYSAEATQTKMMADALDKLASGLTGSMILMLGMLLGHWGILKGAGDENKREEYYDQMLGEQEYSINFMGKNFTLDWLTPVSMPLFTGVELMKMIDGDGELSFNEALDAVGRLADPVMNLSVLQGINDAMSSYDSGLGKMVLSAGESYIGQFIPTLAGQVARTIDPTRRTSYAAKEGEGLGGDLEKFRNKLENKIPFVSKRNAAYVDMWGRQETDSDPWYARAIKNSVLPAYIRDHNKTQADDYISVLFDSTGDRSVIPNTPESSYTFNGETMYLLSDEYQLTKEIVGQISNVGVTSLLSVPGFLELSPEEQAKYVSDIYSFAKAVAKKEYAAAKGIDYELTGTDKHVLGAVNAGMGIGEALYIYKMSNTFSADKNEKGNAIPGTMKKKVLDFYHSLGLTEEQIKAIIPSNITYP